MTDCGRSNFIDGSRTLTVYPQLYSNSLAHLYSSTNARKAITKVSFETAVVGGANQMTKKLLLLGTDAGNVCGYHEVNMAIDSVPIFLWRSDNANNRGMPITSSDDLTEKEISIRPPSKPLSAASSRAKQSYSYRQGGLCIK